MGQALLDLNWRIYKNNSDIIGWPGADAPAALRRHHQRMNTKLGWHSESLVNTSAYTHITRDNRLYMQSGFAALGFMPSTKGAAGKYSAGYDKYDDYDLGSKNQCYSIPTGFGTQEELCKAIAVTRANGMQAYGDLVLHQYDGGPNNTYVYPGSNPKIMNGRFPKHPSCFVGPAPGVNVDAVPDQTGNFPFGAMVGFDHSIPEGYMLNETIKAVQWMVRTTGFDGFRVDDVKGTSIKAMRAILGATELNNLYAVGEYFDGNNNALWNWVNNIMNRRSAVLDFNFKFNVQNICNNAGRVWMGQLANIGYCLVDPYMAVPFCESADTDNSPGEQIVWNKILGYAIMLTFPGYPRIYYRDWSTDENCYGLMDPINNLLWIHNNLAGGDFVPRLDNHPQVFVHERTGWGEQAGCVCFFNNDPNNMYTVRVQTIYSPNTRLHEYTGKYNTDVWTDSQGCITVTVPKNDNGYGYLVFGKWITPEGYNLTPRYTEQTFFGADDLVPGQIEQGTVTVGNIYCQADTWITLNAKIDTIDWTNLESASIIIEDTSNVGDAIAVIQVDNKSDVVLNHGIHVKKSGTYNISIASNLVDEHKTDFEINVTYLAPKTLI